MLNPNPGCLEIVEDDTKVKHPLKNYYRALSYGLIISNVAINGFLPDKACIRIFQTNSDEFCVLYKRIALLT